MIIDTVYVMYALLYEKDYIRWALQTWPEKKVENWDTSITAVEFEYKYDCEN